MVIISEKASIQIAALTTVVDTAVTVGTTKMSAAIFHAENGSYLIVYTGDRLRKNSQIKWAILVEKCTGAYQAVHELMITFLNEQQDSDRLLKPAVITRTKEGSIPVVNVFFTVESARRYYLNVLETGKAYSQEKGAKKINLYPTTVKSLITNLNNALNNAAANGWSNVSYSAES